jgi:hypothetical protein
MSASVAFKALRMAHALRLQLIEATTTDATLSTKPSRKHVQLLRACSIVVILYFIFTRGGGSIDYLTEDLVASKEDGIRMYHRTRNGQR